MKKALILLMMITLVLSACGNKTAIRPGKASNAGQEATTLAPSEGQAEPRPAPLPQPEITMSMKASTPDNPEATAASPISAPETAATAMKPPAASAKPPAAKAVVIQPSRSLAGHDRFLVTQPLGGVRPADFELGSLLDRTSDPLPTTLLDGLAKALKDKKLEAAAFSSQGLLLAKLLYDPDLDSAPLIITVRFSALGRMPGKSYAVGLRLFSDSGSANGLAILGTDDGGNWLIEHLDLELDGLDKPITRNEPWDPYGYSRNLME